MRGAPGDHGDVEVALRQLTLQRGADTDHRLDDKAWVARAERLDETRQPGQRAQFADAEAAAPAKFSGRRRHAGAQCLGRGKQAMRLRHQPLPGFGQHRAMPGAVEERLPERSFQFGNPFGER